MAEKSRPAAALAVCLGLFAASSLATPDPPLARAAGLVGAV